MLQITDVLQWIDTHVYMRRIVIVSDEGKVLGLLTPNNFHNIYHLKPLEVKCNKEYLNNFYVTNSNPHEVMKPWYKEEDDFKGVQGCHHKNETEAYSRREYHCPWVGS